MALLLSLNGTKGGLSLQSIIEKVFVAKKNWKKDDPNVATNMNYGIA
jgi:hypothetical protein